MIPNVHSTSWLTSSKMFKNQIQIFHDYNGIRCFFYTLSRHIYIVHKSVKVGSLISPLQETGMLKFPKTGRSTTKLIPKS